MWNQQRIVNSNYRVLVAFLAFLCISCNKEIQDKNATKVFTPTPEGKALKEAWKKGLNQNSNVDEVFEFAQIPRKLFETKDRGNYLILLQLGDSGVASADFNLMYKQIDAVKLLATDCESLDNLLIAYPTLSRNFLLKESEFLKWIEDLPGSNNCKEHIEHKINSKMFK